jgi:hypothetical protein
MLKRLLFFILFISFSRTIQAQLEEREASLKAVFIYNFTRYIDWDSSINAHQFVIGVIGPSPVTALLTEIARTNKVNDKKIIIRQFNKPEDIEYCEVLFIPRKSPFTLHAILDKVGKKVLTVSEEDGYARQGTAFNFVIVNDKVKFESNINVINAAGLKASSQLLKLAILVD